MAAASQAGRVDDASVIAFSNPLHALSSPTMPATAAVSAAAATAFRSKVLARSQSGWDPESSSEEEEDEEEEVRE